jgi:hypothetical protein
VPILNSGFWFLVNSSFHLFLSLSSFLSFLTISCIDHHEVWLTTEGSNLPRMAACLLGLRWTQKETTKGGQGQPVL